MATKQRLKKQARQQHAKAMKHVKVAFKALAKAKKATKRAARA